MKKVKLLSNHRSVMTKKEIDSLQKVNRYVLMKNFVSNDDTDSIKAATFSLFTIVNDARSNGAEPVIFRGYYGVGSITPCKTSMEDILDKIRKLSPYSEVPSIKETAAFIKFTKSEPDEKFIVYNINKSIKKSGVNILTDDSTIFKDCAISPIVLLYDPETPEVKLAEREREFADAMTNAILKKEVGEKLHKIVDYYLEEINAIKSQIK